MTNPGRLLGRDVTYERNPMTDPTPARPSWDVADVVSVTLLVIGTVCAVVGSWCWWGWPAGVFTVGVLALTFAHLLIKTDMTGGRG